MDIHIRSGYGSTNIDAMEVVVIFLIVAVVCIVVFSCIYFVVKRQDNNKELVVKTAKILEKTVQQGNIQWYVVELENGERLNLRSFQANNIIIAVGDEGIISYKGKTIQKFQRNGTF